MFDGKGSGRELFAAGLLTFGGWQSGGTGRGHLIGGVVSFLFSSKIEECSDIEFLTRTTLEAKTTAQT